MFISLPKGGGALKGIGETFAPDLHTGTGTFTVPVGLPPGRNGFQPKIDLIYSTGNGNGPFGLGWSLSVPGVSRKTSKGVPRYNDEQDTFINLAPSWGHTLLMVASGQGDLPLVELLLRYCADAGPLAWRLDLGKICTAGRACGGGGA